MPIVVNSNTTATTASFNLSRANDALRKSLARLSSGNRIVSPADDAGGMAVAYKLNSKLKRTEAVRQNIQNGISYLQVQDGALGVVGKILDRIAELRTMSMDVTKNSGDIENYSKEFVELQSQLNQIRHQKFNGISLFAINDQDQADFHPESQLVKISDQGGRFRYSDSSDTSDVVGYDKYAFELKTAAGKDTDGSISLSVINFEFMLSLASVADTTWPESVMPSKPLKYDDQPEHHSLKRSQLHRRHNQSEHSRFDGVDREACGLEGRKRC